MTAVTLPDPLPEAVQAALRLRVDTARGLDKDAIARQIARSVWAGCVVDPLTWQGYDHATVLVVDVVRAVLVLHPELARSELGPQMWAATWADKPPDRTELGLAERLVAVCGHQLAHNPASGVWAVWNGRCWEPDESGVLAAEQVKVVVRTLIAIESRNANDAANSLLEQIGDPKNREVVEAFAEAKAAGAFLQRAQQARFIRSALELARGEPGLLVPECEWDARPDLLPTADGTVELTDTGAKAREHRREDRLTRITRAAYRPRADPTDWDRFVREVMPDPDVRQRVQRLAGLTLFGGNPERLMVVLLGRSTTGKSTLTETLARALGEYSGTFDLALFRSSREGGAPRSDLLAALPRRMIATTEASARWELHADQIKRLTGGDTLVARGLYARTAVERRPSFVPWLATNAAPRIVGGDDALMRRLEVIPFNTVISREDPGLGRRLREQHADAVLAWAVTGWEQYARHGLGPVPTACTVAAATLRADTSLVDAWLADVTVADPEAWEPVSRVAESWHYWCAEQYVPERERISSVALGRELTARGIHVGHVGGKADRQRVRHGLRLLVHPELPLRSVR